MIDLKNFFVMVEQIAEEKNLSKERILETIEQALAAAYKKEYGQKGQVIKAKLDSATGKMNFWQVKLVVDKEMIYSDEELEAMKEKAEKEPEGDLVPDEENKKVRFNEERHIMLEEALKIQPGVKAGDDLDIQLESLSDFGRIAAQTAKQVILQKIREAERDAIVQEFKSKEGEIVSGIIQRVEGKIIFVDMGKTLGIMPKEEQVQGEFYRPGQRLKFFVVKVESGAKGPTILLSRAHAQFVSRLFELEVPELRSESVEIKAIAREAGSRSKVAVASHQDGVDPVGSMVGQRGTRVSAVINELGGEKIDIIEWSEDPEVFVANALSPAKALTADIADGKAVARVAEDQLSLAIGRDGQNVRLAAKLTGWRIDIRTPDGKEIAVEDEEGAEGAEEESVKEENTESV